MPQAWGCAACKAVFDPDLEQGDNTNVVVRPTARRPVFSSPLVPSWTLLEVDLARAVRRKTGKW